MKKLISALLTVIMVLSMSPSGIYASTYDENAKIINKANNFHEKKSDLDESQKKLSSDLVKFLKQDTISDKRESKQAEKVLKEMDALVYAGDARLNGLKPSSDDLVYVYIQLNSKVKTNKIDTYANTVISRDDENSVAAAWVEKGKLKKLAALTDVQSIRTVLPPIVRSGSAISEGDGLLNAESFRSLAGTDGSGIKIGVISDGVNSLASAQASGDLPNNVHVLRDDIGGDEGTAMLEIIHDLAPGAELYFHDLGGNIFAFNDAITSLANEGCNIICDDIGWLDEPYFEDGFVAKNVKNILSQRNIVYISAAGNSAEDHYQGSFSGDENGFHQFDKTTGANLMEIFVPAGNTMRICLQWDDKFGSSSNDYDLLLLDENIDELIALSDNTQDENFPYPIEWIEYTASSNQYVYLAVGKYLGSNKTLEFYVDGGYVQNYATSADSIFGHPAVPEVIAVGAINASDTDSIASYSSHGPCTIKYPTAQARKKPDLCGIDEVSITGAGGFSNPFRGTSAAAPHIAAVAALVWSQNPDKKASDIRSMVCNGTIDYGTPGIDNVYGSGLSDVVKTGGPAKPSVLSAVPNDRQVALAWDANSDNDLAGYVLEYKTASATVWTSVFVAKTVTNYTVSSLVNNTEYQFRFRAKDAGNAYSIYSDIVSVTPYTAAKITGAVESTFKEGLEDGKKITIALANGTFIPVIDADAVQVTGLPEGVMQGAVTRTGNNALTIALAGISTVDYDTDIVAQITIGEDQVSTVKPEELSCFVTLKATAEPKPLKPTVTFSFDGTNARQLKGINNTMEYSLDGGVTFTPAVSANQVLTGEELNNINADKDIRVRVAATLRAPASDLTTIAITSGPSIPAVTGNDTINTVSGMTTSMEFTTDTNENVWEWSWIRYATTPAPNNLPLLNGDKELKVRIAGKGATMPSAFKLIEFSENEPLEVNAVYNGQTSDEGKEAGKLITITLTNGQFVSSINKDMFQLTGLPAGIAKGDVKRTGNATVTIALLKNSTADYDTDYETTIKIDKNQILPLQSDNIKTAVILPAFDDPIPAPPNVTFSYKTNPGKLMGSNTTMEYSLDGGITYKTVSASNMQLTAVQLAQLQLDPANDIRIRVKATPRAVPGEDKVLNIDPIPDPPPIDASDADSNNRLQGIDSTMEFSIDKGKTWKVYNGSNLPADLTGNLTIMVRISATDSAPVGPAATYTFTATNPALSISAVYESGTAPEQKAENGSNILVILTNGKFISKLTATEIKITGLPSGITAGAPVIVNNTTLRIPLKGNASAYYDVGTVITISVGKGQVLPVQPAALTTTMRLLGSAKDPAPTGIGFSFATDIKGVVTGALSGVDSTMEYSLDGGAKYTSITSLTGLVSLTSAQTAVITETKEIKVRYKAVLASSKSASNDYVIDIEKPSAPSVTNDDAANSISGINDAMIFSKDGGKTWAIYTETDGGTLPQLDGNLTLMVKSFAEGHNLASSPVTLSFTSTNPGLSISASSFSAYNDSPSTIDEGTEGNRYIIVTLTNGKFANTVSTTTVKLTGLPKGVSIPSTNGIRLINNNTQLKVLLQGNSTEDYEVDKTVTITVDKGQLLPAPQPLALSTTITFTAVDEDAPSAPAGVDFSFNGTNAKKLTGVNNTMEYSLDGGTKYTAITTTSGSPNAITLSVSQIAAITVDRDIRVRYKAVTATKAPPSNYFTIDIAKHGVPDVTYNDDENSISDIDSTMEFSTDGGKTWKIYTGSNLPADLSGNLTIKVRTFASGHNIVSDPVTLAFTSARPMLTITAGFIGDNAPIPGESSYSGVIRVSLSGDSTEYGMIAAALTQAEIKLTGLPAGIKQGTAVRVDASTIDIPITGTNVAYYDANKVVTVSIGKTQVKPAQAAALTTPLIFPGDVESPRRDAPTGISFSFNTGKITGVNTSMEYSLNGGSTYIAVGSTTVTLSASQLSSITADNDILVRFKYIPATKTPASLNYVIEITKPAAPEIDWSDETNTITDGIDSTMEFSTDNGKIWTACIDPKTGKNNVTAKNLTGNITIQVRLKKGGTSVAGEAATLTFTATNPLLELSGMYSGTTEGQENGNTITVTLENGTFISSLKTSEVVVTGLPAGVTVASKNGITKLNSTQIRIQLSGNSTEDYDDEKVVTVTVGKAQLLPAPQINPVIAEISLPFTDESTSEAPEVTFSFSDENAGRLMGITTTMEYSLDGGTEYIPATASNVKMSSVQLAKITAENGILIRVRATLRDPAGEAVLIEITTGPEAPDVTADDQNDTVTDLDTSMEYSKNNGLTWTRFNGSNAPIMTGDTTLLVRLCAADTSVAGDITTLFFSEENLELNINAEYEGTPPVEGEEGGTQIAITLTDGEFVSDNDPNWLTIQGLPEGVVIDEIQIPSNNRMVITLKGNSEEDYDSDKVVTVTIDKNQFRPSQKENPSCSIILPASVEADQYGLVKAYVPENGFYNEKVKLLTADGETKYYYFSDNLDAAVLEGQLVAYALNQHGEISSIATNAAITLAPGSLTILSAEQATIDGIHYDIADEVVVFKYSGTAPGADCDYDFGGIDYIRLNKSISSPASIYLNNGEISAILLPQTVMISEPTGLAGIAPTTAANNDGRITGVDNSMEFKLSTDMNYSTISGDEVTGLAAGTYYVRYAANGSDPVGPAVTVIVPEYVTADQYGIVKAFESGIAFDNEEVRLFTADGATRTYYYSDDLDAELTPGQFIAYGLDQDGRISTIATNGAISIDSGCIISDVKTVTIGGISYSIPDNAPVFTYNGTAPGVLPRSYDVTTIGSITLNEPMSSPVIIYLNQTTVTALLVPASTAYIINYESADGLTLHVNEYFMDDPDTLAGTIGPSIPSGGIAPAGGWHGILISADIEEPYRLISLIFNEEIDGDIWTDDITYDIAIIDAAIYYPLYGNVTIAAITELVPPTLPEISGIELYKSYDIDTNTYSDQITSTASGISLNDTIYAKILFDVAVPGYAPVEYLWQEMQEGGVYSDDNFMDGFPPFSLDLSQWSDRVADNYVRLTISGVDKYSTGEAAIEFYVSTDPGFDSTISEITSDSTSTPSDSSPDGGEDDSGETIE